MLYFHYLAANTRHLKLGNLIALYDDNHISIDGDTNLGFTEDVCKRFESYGWHTIVVDNGDTDLASIEAAIAAAKLVTDKPTLIKVRTTIGFGSLNQGEEKVHGSPLSALDIEQLKNKLGFDSTKSFEVPASVYAFWSEVQGKNRNTYDSWEKLYKGYTLAHPELVFLVIMVGISARTPAKRQITRKLSPAFTKILHFGSSDSYSQNERKLVECGSRCRS